MKKIWVAIFVGLLSLSACNLQTGNLPGTPTDSFETMVAQTLTAIEFEKSATPSLTLPPATLTKTQVPSYTFTPTLTLAPTLTLTPTKTLAPTSTEAPTKTPIPKPGTIQGSISGYPYGSLPSLSIVAFMQEPPYNYSYWITAPGDSFYSMSSSYLLPGKYQVVAYDALGNSGGCAGLATVKSEESVTCNISDWSGSYPPKPAGVPSP